MSNKQIIKELREIQQGIEGDRYTYESINSLLMRL